MLFSTSLKNFLTKNCSLFPDCVIWMSLCLFCCLLINCTVKGIKKTQHWKILSNLFPPTKTFLSCSMAFLSTFHTIVLCLVDQQYPAPPPPPPPPPPPMFGCHNPSESCSSSQALLLRNYNRYSQSSSHAVVLSLLASLCWLMIFKERKLSLILRCEPKSDRLDPGSLSLG